MKKNLPVTQVEEHYASTANILSTTDLKGAITYVNNDFVDISGFDKSELIGKNHNLVRHPDMPPAAFQDLWATVKQGRSWMGVVKNRCKNGNHYWVDAYVTPIERNGVISEYQSVRRKPAKVYVERAEKIYPALLAGKVPSVLKPGISLLTRVLACTLTPFIFLAAALILLDVAGLTAGILALIAALASALGLLVVFKPYRQVVERARAVVSNPVAQYIYSGRSDDLGQIMLALKMLESETAGLVGRIADSACTLTDGATGLNVAVNQSESGVRHQFAETDQVAAAVNEMSASVQEVAQNAQNSSVAAAQGLQEVTGGKRVVDESMYAIQRLKQEIAQAATVIAEVKESSNSISGILDVIGGVAEQTNLLALNAAIEAARAGEAGRGFAVVADEVRSLASRTQTSTDEIRQMIERLQNNANKAVTVMEAGQQQTDACVEQNAQTVESLNSIYSAIELISDLNAQIATAAEQQSAVAEEINRSIYNIRDMSEQNLEAVELSAKTSQEMLKISKGFSELSAQFWAKQNS